MGTYYRANKVIKKERIKEYRNESEIWKTRKPLLIAGIIICVLIFMIVFIYFVLHGDVKDKAYLPFIAFCVAFLSTLIPGAVLQELWMKYWRKSASPYIDYANEYVFMGEDCMSFMFHDRNNKLTNSMTEYRIPYHTVKEIKLDFLNILTITADNVKMTQYSDYSSGIVTNEKTIKENAAVKIMLYFDEEEKFLNDLIYITGHAIE